MSQYLPTGRFDLVTVSNIENQAEFILKQGDEQEEGFFPEVDLEYPEELHYPHDTYPFAPEKLKIEEKLLSEHPKK